MALMKWRGSFSMPTATATSWNPAETHWQHRRRAEPPVAHALCRLTMGIPLAPPMAQTRLPGPPPGMVRPQATAWTSFQASPASSRAS